MGILNRYVSNNRLEMGILNRYVSNNRLEMGILNRYVSSNRLEMGILNRYVSSNRLGILSTFSARPDLLWLVDELKMKTSEQGLPHGVHFQFSVWIWIWSLTTSRTGCKKGWATVTADLFEFASQVRLCNSCACCLRWWCVQQRPDGHLSLCSLTRPFPLCTLTQPFPLCSLTQPFPLCSLSQPFPPVFTNKTQFRSWMWKQGSI